MFTEIAGSIYELTVSYSELDCEDSIIQHTPERV